MGVTEDEVFIIMIKSEQGWGWLKSLCGNRRERIEKLKVSQIKHGFTESFVNVGDCQVIVFDEVHNIIEQGGCHMGYWCWVYYERWDIILIQYHIMVEVTSSFKATIIGLMIIAGAINTLAYKFQNKQLVYQGPYYKYFFHPYMQATTMFFGEFLAIIAFFALKYRNPQKYKMEMLQARSQGKQIKMNKFLLAIPAFCDFVTSTLQYIALNFIPGSVYQMMRGGTIITTFICSIVFLKAKVQMHQVVGSILAFLGVLIVGISNSIFSNGSSSSASGGLVMMGYILIIASLFFNGFFFVFEQKLLSKYHLNPLQVVGYQGAFGLSLYLVLLPILSFIPCGFGVEACVFSYEGFPYLQKPFSYFSEAFSNGGLLFFCILGIFSIATFNIAGVTVTKHINALARSISDVTRTILVWGVSLIITVSAGSKYPNYKWQLVGVGAILLQLFGFVILVMGNLVYNQIIKLPGAARRQNDESLLSADQSQNQITNS